MKSIIRYLISGLFVIMTIQIGYAQQRMRIQGVVMSDDTQNTVSDVAIIHNNILRGETNQDGKFSIMASKGEELLFIHTGYDDVVVRVGSAQVINVVLKSQLLSIDKIVVSSKKRNKHIIIEPTDIEIVGNYFNVKTNIRVPNDKITTDSRFILQPILFDVTQGRQTNLRPVVIDGKNYRVVTHRHMNFGDSVDTLRTFVVDEKVTIRDDIFTYRDSIYIDRNAQDNDYKISCHLVIGSYDPPLKYSDTLVMATGTINPLRFFDKSLCANSLDESKIAPPEPDLELYNTRGVANIEFEMGRSAVNYQWGENRQNIDVINDIISAIQSDPNSTLKSIKMRGYASPEGGEKTNQTLADKRTREVMNIVTSTLETSHISDVDIDAKGVVEPWSRLIDLAVADDNTVLVEKLRTIITRAKGSYPSTQYMVLRLPEYQSIIKPRYLPRLRRVEYEIDYTIFRPLTIGEVREKYTHQEERLTRSEYYLMIGEEQDSLKRIKYEQAAIRDYPNFLIYLNREAVRLIDADSTNLTLLQPVMESKGLPQEVIHNQVAMLLMEGLYDFP